VQVAGGTRSETGADGHERLAVTEVTEAA